MNQNLGQTGTSNATSGNFDPNKVNNMQFHFDPSSMTGTGIKYIRPRHDKTSKVACALSSAKTQINLDIHSV